GSPYHMRLGALNGSGGNQDRSLSAEAVIFPASITIIKDAVPNDAQDFSFSTPGGLAPTPFVLDDDPASVTPTNTQAFTGITTFTTYTVTEAAAAGWTQSFPSPACTVTSANGGTQNAANATVTINLKEGENVTCTFTNTRQTGTLQVTKILSPANDGGLFNLQIDGSTSAANVGNNGTTGPVVVTTGTHSVGETAGNGTNLNDYTSTINCGSGDVAGPGPVNVNVANGQAAQCTITNTRHTGRINV